MMKKIYIIKRVVLSVLIAVLFLSLMPMSLASEIMVSPTASTVIINGADTSVEAYLINGNNYFKLRDLAYALNGSLKQFEVGYDDAAKAITLTSGKPYTPDGSEMKQGDGTTKPATLNSNIIITKDHTPVEITAYLINGNNFMRLRDVMRLLDVFVGYDTPTQSITIDTSKGYVEESEDSPQALTPAPESEPQPEVSPTPPPATSSQGSNPIPPQSSTVYWTPNGTVYHSTSGCRSLARSRDIRSGTIAQSGKSRGCNNCVR